MMSATIGAYQAVFFENVAQAVEFCHALVPHIVRHCGTSLAADERVVVWFHVPARSRNSTRDGCYLFASAGAIAAAERAGLDAPLCGRVTRAALPPDCVLLFGDDIPPAPVRVPAGRRSRGARTALDQSSYVPGAVDIRA
jgi:hypothetical protein